MKHRKFTANNLRYLACRARAYTRHVRLGGASWLIHGRSGMRTTTACGGSDIPSSGVTDPTGASSSRTANAERSAAVGGGPTLAIAPASWWRWIRQLIVNSTSLDLPKTQVCPVCRKNLQPFLYADGRVGIRMFWVHPDGTVRNAEHDVFPVWTLFGGDGGA